MATKQVVTRVWIEPGCIVCDACETTAPTVFHVTDDTCVIRPEATNPDFLKPITQSVIDAAEECPVDVIKFETVAAEVDEAAETAAPSPQPAAPATEKKPEKPAHKPAPAEKAEPAIAVAAKAPVADAHVSVAGEGDPSIRALLLAATSRGGSAALSRRLSEVPESVDTLRSKSAKDLPPDARQAKVLEAARKAKGDPNDPTRRAVIGGAALAVGWATFGASSALSGWAFGVRFMVPNVLEEPDPRVRVGPLQRYAEMKPGEVNEDYKPQGIWMIREEERIAALNIICTHLGCIPNWLPNDRKFKCPCHGSGYFPNGVNFEGPTPRPLERFRIYVEDGEIVVDKSKKYQHELGQWDQPGSFIAV